MAKTNILQERTAYNRYYGDFRGVDFSSDHTQVHEQRLAYAVNMYKDYQSGQGQALETIAGFRKRVVLPEENNVHGIFNFSHRNENNEVVTKVLIHSGNKLYLWNNYPNTINVVLSETIVVPAPSSTINGTHTFVQSLPNNVATVVALAKTNGEDLTLLTSYDSETHELSYASSSLAEGDRLILSYKEGVINIQDALFSDMNNRKSASFIFNNKLYIIDGKNYLVYDGEKITNVLDTAYIPTTYINIIPNGENADIGVEYEQRNILRPKFKTTFIADGTTTEFYLNENELDEISEVKLYGNVVAESDYTVDLLHGKVTFNTAPTKPQETVQIAAEDGGSIYYPEQYAGVEITAKKVFTSISGVTDECSVISELITNCTICAIYDNRVFLSGNPDYPNHIFYCARNTTGYVDPTYFGILNYMQDGVGIAPITGMITVADTLMVLKNDTQQDGSTYFHTATETGNDLQPKIYPSSQGLSGIGCLGACVNFLDDPIFISRLGVEAVSQLSVRNERANEHRSSLIDAKIANMDLSSAMVCEWNGYLLLLVDGNIFMAAQQAADIYTEAKIHVIPSKNIGSGYVALSCANFELDDADAIANEMTEALGRVTAGYVSPSIRDAEINGVTIKNGDTIGIIGKEIVLSNPDQHTAALGLTEKILEGDKFMLTVFCGKDASTEQQAALQAGIQKAYPAIEVYFIDGGQDIYPFIFVAE